MAIVLTAGTAANLAAAGTLTMTLPAGMSAGDYTLVLITSNTTSTAPTVPTGYSTVLADTVSTAQTGCHGALYYRAWQSGDANPASTVTGRSAGIAIRVQGADATTFIDAAAVVNQEALSATTGTAPAVTPGVTGAGLLHAYFARTTSTTSTISYTTPTGDTSGGYAPGVTTNNNNSGAAFYRTDTTSGSATATAVTTFSGTSTGAFSVSFTINPAATATVTKQSNQDTNRARFRAANW